VALKSNIGKIRAGLRGAAAKGNHRAAQFVASLAYQLAPEDTGDLKRSVQVETEPDELRQVVSAGKDIPDIRAVAQEYGTATSEAQPFMTPAARAIKPEREIAAELRDLYRSNGL
jgi:hypothetical protein